MPPHDTLDPDEPVDRKPAGPVARLLWLAAGLTLVGIGGIGVVVPGLPTTVFFIGAAACFARSSRSLERWVLHLPHVGPLVKDYRAGLGMPRRAKRLAVVAIVVAVGLSLVAIPTALGSVLVVALAGIGIGYILIGIPTRERIEAEREATTEQGDIRPDDS